MAKDDFMKVLFAAEGEKLEMTEKLASTNPTIDRKMTSQFKTPRPSLSKRERN